MLQVILATLVAALSLLAVVLRRHNIALHPVAECVALDRSDSALAQKIERSALLELGNTVVLAAESDETADLDTGTSFDETAQELSSLTEAESVYTGVVGAEVRVCCEIRADLVDLRGYIAEEARSCVGAAFVGHADRVDIGAWVHFLCELADCCDAVCVEAISETVPDYQRKRRRGGHRSGDGEVGEGQQRCQECAGKHLGRSTRTILAIRNYNRKKFDTMNGRRLLRCLEVVLVGVIDERGGERTVVPADVIWA